MQMHFEIESNVESQLDLASVKVQKAVGRGIYATAKSAYDSMMATMDSYGWGPPNTTGNLRDTTGFFVKSGSRYNLTNWRTAQRANAGILGVELPDIPYEESAVLFSNAPYAEYVEFGTMHMSAKPYFYANAERAGFMLTPNIKRAVIEEGLVDGATAW